MDITNIIQLSKKNILEVNILFFSVILLPVSLFVGPLITEILVFLIIELNQEIYTLRSHHQ